METILNEKDNKTVAISIGDDKIQISYMGSNRRDVLINDKKFNITAIIREKPFTYPGAIGKPILGIYDPAAGYYANTANRLVYQENVVTLSDAAEYERWKRQGSALYKRAYVADGVVISFSVSPRGYNIDLNRILIGDKPLEKL